MECRLLANSFICWYNICQSEDGRIAQWLEHLLHTQGVTGSSPVSPTIRKNMEATLDTRSFLL
jgi:hypothetical protein